MLSAIEPAKVNGFASPIPAAADRDTAVRLLPPPVWMFSEVASMVGVPPTNASSTIKVAFNATAKPLLS